MSNERMAPDDDRIADYVRSRGDVDLPPTFVDQVLRAVTDAPQSRSSWFGALTLPLAAATAVALILVVAALVSSPSRVGPEPAPEPTATPAPTLTPTDALSLTQPGDVVRIAAVDSEGQFGTITIERGDEVAGYEGGHDPLAYDAFFVELYISYALDRPSTAAHGESDWGYRINGDFQGSDASFTTWSGPFAGATTPTPALRRVESDDIADIEGWLVIPIWSEAADSPITLDYSCSLPSTPDEPGPLQDCWKDPDARETDDSAYALIALREPGPPVGSTPAWTPPPGFELPPVEVESHEEADALFVETSTCANAASGYELRFPVSWFADATCTRFSATPIDESDPAAVSTITIERREGGEPNLGEVELIPVGGSGSVDGVEVGYFHLQAWGEAVVPIGERILAYHVNLVVGEYPTEDNEVPWLLATTTSVEAASDEEYDLNRAVLHRIITSMQFTQPETP